jgi:hypothetical protein
MEIRRGEKVSGLDNEIFTTQRKICTCVPDCAALQAAFSQHKLRVYVSLRRGNFNHHCIQIITSTMKLDQLMLSLKYFFLVRLAKSRKATITSNFVTSVCPSVRMKKFGCRGKDFLQILYWRIFRKSVEKIQVSLKFYKNKECLT